ncbi:MAG: chlorophyll synthase ChlG [Caulobacterales bacterium]|jgi:chlorophyll synthase
MTVTSLPPTRLAAPRPQAVLELLKPITWFAPMWAFVCGVVSTGQPLAGREIAILAGVVLAGPMVCGASQAANDWFDRHVDAINEPNRPIPSGRIPGRWGLYIAIAWSLASLALAATLGPWVFGAGIVGIALAWAYSAPPLRLKQSGWWGPATVGLCYEGVAWFTGAAVMTASLPDPRILAMVGLYSFGALGIMVLNDFKAIEGDKAMGVRSLPVQYGVNTAARIACAIMAAPQVMVVALLVAWGKPVHAFALAIGLGVQLVLMRRLLSDPRRYAPWYNATGTSLSVLGMLVAAFAIGAIVGG